MMDARFYIPAGFDECSKKQDDVARDVKNLLDGYVKHNDVSVSDMHVALESYREMLAVNSTVKPAKE